MAKSRRQYSASFKAKVALSAIKGDRTTAQLSSYFGVHPSQIRVWKKQLIEGLPSIFSNRRKNHRTKSVNTINPISFDQKDNLQDQMSYIQKMPSSLQNMNNE